MNHRSPVTLEVGEQGVTNHNQVIRPGEVTHCEKAAEDIFPPKPWLDPGEGEKAAGALRTPSKPWLDPGEGEKAAGALRTPSKPWLDPGEGWRLLEGAERFQKCDEIYDDRCDRWVPMADHSTPLVNVLLGYSWIKAVRRRVETEKAQAIEEQEQFDRTNHIEPVMQIVPQSANSIQHGGDHYRSKPIQPWDYIASNGLGFFEGNIVKYVTRWPERGGLVDLKKAQHYIEKLIEIETAKETGQ